MAQPFAAPPINPLISVQPLNTPQAGRDAPEVPAALTSAANGTTVEGFVVNRDAQNNPILRTPLGDILIKSDFFLKTGSVVVFRVDNTQASRARIITIDGLTPTDYAIQQARAPQTDTIEQSVLPNTSAPIGETEQQTRLQGKPAVTPQTQPPPLKAVLVTPSALLVPETKTPGTKSTTASFTPGGTPAQTESPLPLILAKLQAGALLKITVLKAELPVFIPAPASPATPHLQPLGVASLTAQPTVTAATTAPAAITAGIPPATVAPPHTPLSAPPIAASHVATTLPLQPSATTVPAPPPAAEATIPGTPPALQPLPLGPLPAALTSPINQTAAIPSQQNVAPALPQPAVISSPPATGNPPSAPAKPASPYAPPSLSATTTAFSAYRTATIRAPQSPDSHAAPQPFQPAPLRTTSGPPPTDSYTSRPASPVAPRQEPFSGFTATVIGHELDGATILHTRIGTLKTFLPQPLPTGTQLTVHIEPDDGGVPLPSPGTLSKSMETVTTLARDWKSLGETLHWLQANDPATLNQLTQQLPNAGPRLASGLLFFIAAIKGGDIRAWLGNRAADALEKKAPEIISRLRTDASQLQQLATEAPGRNWAMLMLPVMVEGQLDQARLFYRQEEEPTPEGRKKTNGRHHRFIIEVDLSQLGSLQFDGFVRDGREKRVFDLIIRSARPLADSVSADIRNLFDNALKTTGYRGYLTFQQGSQHFVRPLADFNASSGDNQPILA